MSRPTGDAQHVPDLFVIGAMRSGTTTLFELIGRCDGVFAPEVKEPHFWAFDDRPDYTGPGDGWFRRSVVTDLASYRALYESAPPGDLRIEGSAMYVYLPHSIARILEAKPQARFVMILRQPSERSYSAFTYQVGRNREPERDFRVALSLEEERRRAGYAPIWHYRRASEYGRQLRDLLELVDPERLLLITTEELATDSRSVVRRVLEHAGRDDIAPPDDLGAISNRSRWPTRKRLDAVMFPEERVARLFRPLVKGPIRLAVDAIRQLGSRSVPSMDDDVRHELDVHFARDLGRVPLLEPFQESWGLLAATEDGRTRRSP